MSGTPHEDLSRVDGCLRYKIVIKVLLTEKFSVTMQKKRTVAFTLFRDMCRSTILP